MKRIFVLLTLMSLTLNLFSDASGLQVRGGLPHFFSRIQNKEMVTVAYLGGSITEWEKGYREQTAAWMQKTYPSCKFRFINAGVGGTGSNLGVYRTDKDVLAYNPDLVFVEFAVNDRKTDSLDIVNSVEGIIHKIYQNNVKTDICMLYTINEDMLLALQRGGHVRSVETMEKICDYYHIASINLQPDILKRLKSHELIFRGKGPFMDNQMVFCEDGTHPFPQTGHKLYAETIKKALETLSKERKVVVNHALKKPLLGNIDLSEAKIYPLTNKFLKGKWVTPSNSTMNDYLAKKDILVLEDSADAAFLRFSFEGNQFGFYDIIGPESGCVEISIDGKTPYEAMRFDDFCQFYRKHFYLSEYLPEGKHVVIIKNKVKQINKIERLRTRFSDDSIGDKSRYDKSCFFPFAILVNGIITE
jgi:lysophospholipase L1-like esterase